MNYDINTKLKDNGSSIGGTTHEDEELWEFMLEADMDFLAPLDEINKVLPICGIKPIKKGIGFTEKQFRYNYDLVNGNQKPVNEEIAAAEETNIDIYAIACQGVMKERKKLRSEITQIIDKLNSISDENFWLIYTNEKELDFSMNVIDVMAKDLYYAAKYHNAVPSIDDLINDKKSEIEAKAADYDYKIEFTSDDRERSR